MLRRTTPEGSARQELPEFAVFDDYRYSQRIAVVVRWLLLLTWLLLLNYRTDWSVTTLIYLNGMGAALAALNGYVHWRVWNDRPITRPYVLALSAMDLTIITAAIGMTTRFHNSFFVFYYPALLGLSLVFPSLRLSLTAVTLVAIVYVTLATVLSPGVSYTIREEKTLVVRVVTMFVVVVAAHLFHGIERTRRRAAVEAERAQAQRNLELQRQAQEAELTAQEDRHRIAREIHDGIAQSIYALSLSLETCADLSQREGEPLRERLQKLVSQAKETLLETRHYVHDLKPLLSGEQGLMTMAENQIKEFRTVARTPTSLSVEGEPSRVSAPVAAGFYRILQEALSNVLKHAQASDVKVTLTFAQTQVRLRVEDDGIGFGDAQSNQGYGLGNIRERAQELGGSCEIVSVPGKGTRVSVALPTLQEGHGDH